MITYNKLRKNVTVSFQDIKVKTYTVMAFTLVTVFVLAAFAIRPVVFTLSDEIGQYGQLQKQDTTIKSDLYSLAQAEYSYNANIAGKTDALDSALPTSLETGPFFANLYAIAQGDGVEIDSVRFLSLDENDLASLHIQPKSIITYAGASPLIIALNGKGTQSA